MINCHSTRLGSQKWPTPNVHNQPVRAFYAQVKNLQDQFYPLTQIMLDIMRGLNNPTSAVKVDLANIALIDQELTHLATLTINDTQKLPQLLQQLDSLIISFHQICCDKDKPYSLINLNYPNLDKFNALQEVHELANNAYLRQTEADFAAALTTHTKFSKELQPQSTYFISHEDMNSFTSANSENLLTTIRELNQVIKLFLQQTLLLADPLNPKCKISQLSCLFIQAQATLRHMLNPQPQANLSTTINTNQLKNYLIDLYQLVNSMQQSSSNLLLNNRNYLNLVNLLAQSINAAYQRWLPSANSTLSPNNEVLPHLSYLPPKSRPNTPTQVANLSAPNPKSMFKNPDVKSLVIRLEQLNLARDSKLLNLTNEEFCWHLLKKHISMPNANNSSVNLIYQVKEIKNTISLDISFALAAYLVYCALKQLNPSPDNPHTMMDTLFNINHLWDDKIEVKKNKVNIISFMFTTIAAANALKIARNNLLSVVTRNFFRKHFKNIMEAIQIFMYVNKYTRHKRKLLNSRDLRDNVQYSEYYKLFVEICGRNSLYSVKTGNSRNNKLNEVNKLFYKYYCQTIEDPLKPTFEVIPYISPHTLNQLLDGTLQIKQ
jgi:hypothetical protein